MKIVHIFLIIFISITSGFSMNGGAYNPDVGAGVYSPRHLIVAMPISPRQPQFPKRLIQDPRRTPPHFRRMGGVTYLIDDPLIIPGAMSPRMQRINLQQPALQQAAGLPLQYPPLFTQRAATGVPLYRQASTKRNIKPARGAMRETPRPPYQVPPLFPVATVRPVLPKRTVSFNEIVAVHNVSHVSVPDLPYPCRVVHLPPSPRPQRLLRQQTARDALPPETIEASTVELDLTTVPIPPVRQMPKFTHDNIRIPIALCGAGLTITATYFAYKSYSETNINTLQKTLIVTMTTDAIAITSCILGSGIFKFKPDILDVFTVIGCVSMFTNWVTLYIAYMGEISDHLNPNFSISGILGLIGGVAILEGLCHICRPPPSNT